MNRYESHVFKRAGFGAGDLRRLSRPGQVALRRLLFEHLLQAYRDASWEWGNVEATRDRLFCFAREEEHKDLFVGPGSKEAWPTFLDLEHRLQAWLELRPEAAAGWPRITDQELHGWEPSGAGYAAGYAYACGYQD